MSNIELKLQSVTRSFFQKATFWKVIFFIALSLLLRLSLFNTESGDYRGFLSLWYDYIVNNGFFLSLKDRFHNYQMPYLYLLTLASFLPVKKIYAIKLVSVIFDYIAAYFVYKTVRVRYGKQSYIPVTAMIFFLFTPTVFLNSSGWGQCDVIYSTFLLIAAYYCLKRRYHYVFLFFSIAFSFKLQAMFFAPVLLILCYKKELSILYFLYIPAVYFLSVIPAWIAGRGINDLLTTYLKQGSNYAYLNMNAPNLYAWISNDYYDVVTILGLIFTISLIVFACYYISRYVRFDSSSRWLEIILFFLILIPYFLPKMHDRFFFPADLFSVIYLFYFPRRWYIPLSMLLASVFVYPPLNHLMNWPPLVAPLPLVALTGIAYYLVQYDKKSVPVKK